MSYQLSSCIWNTCSFFFWTFWCFSKCWLWQACWSLVITYFSKLEWIRKNCILIFIFNPMCDAFLSHFDVSMKKKKKILENEWFLTVCLGKCNIVVCHTLRLFILKNPHVLCFSCVNFVLVFIFSANVCIFQLFRCYLCKKS